MKARFSDRIGVTTLPTAIQTEGMTAELRNSLWNYLSAVFTYHEDNWRSLAVAIAQFLLRTPVDELSPHPQNCRVWIRQNFYGWQWFEVYNGLEFIVDQIDNFRECGSVRASTKEAVFVINGILEHELSGYRFIGDKLAPISSTAETEGIADALG